MSKAYAYSVAITVVGGIIGWSIRVAAGKPHATMVGIATAAVFAGICIVVLAIEESS